MWRWCLVLGVGCADVCPSPQASGGSATEQRAVEQEAAAILELMVPGICVPKIRLTNLSGTQVGKYTPTSRQIRVQKDRPIDEMRSTVRHELCHALQFQEDLDLSGDTFFLALPLDIPDDERPGESFAYTCQLGPEVAYLIGDTCPEDGPGSEIFPFIQEYFYPPAAIQDVADVRFMERGRVSVGSDASWTPTLTGALRVEVQGQSPRVFDLQTGLAGTDGPDLSGPAAVEDRELYLQVALAANGAQPLRWVFSDPSGRKRVACVGKRDVAFAFSGELWLAQRKGNDLVWGVWGPAL